MLIFRSQGANSKSGTIEVHGSRLPEIFTLTKLVLLSQRSAFEKLTPYNIQST